MLTIYNYFYAIFEYQSHIFVIIIIILFASIIFINLLDYNLISYSIISISMSIQYHIE
jgi:hypothetical protein